MDAERRLCRLRVFPLLPGKRDASSGCQWRVVFLSFETFKIMRNMKKRIFSLRTLLSGVLAMLCFAGCEKAWNGECEYGMPMVDYRVIGEVTDEAGKPLSGIRVIVKDKYLYNKDGDDKHTYNHEGDTVYTDAKYKYEDLLKDIKEATSSIHMLYFIINNDDIGKKVINALAEKAKQGVTVRVLYDHGGSLFTPYKAFSPILENGGEVKRFFPISFGSYLRVNFRNHRKIVVIDGKIGYVGGINIGDEYLGLKRRLSPWRDTHLKITGSSVYCLQMRFMEDWYYACRDDFRYDDIMKYFAPINEHDKGNTGVQIVSSGPDTNGEEIKRGMIKMINSAKKRILIQTPYFIPDEPFLEALQNAALAGIEVIVQIPSIPDKRFVYKVTTSYIADLLKFDIKVYQFPGFLHAKMMIVDDTICTVGTSNIDMRSFALNFEVNAFLYGEEFSNKCIKIFYKDLDICIQVTDEEYSSRSLFSKIEEGIYRLMSPLL